MCAMRFVVLAFLVALALPLAHGQSLEERTLNLQRLNRESTEKYAARKSRVLEFARSHNLPTSYRDASGSLVVMFDVSPDNVPQYKTVDNAGAAITTGVTKLRDGGGLGLNLEGEGITVGVWDGGIVDDHIEFDARILSREGTAEDDHATHVTGTILASGINSNAKGMAPKAKAFTFDFDNDEAEMLSMARPDQSGLVLSNHSYGLIAGWRFDAGSWQWFGNANISNQEDYKFGYYSSNAQFWDQISHNAPYYLIVKSAGNDRTDTGPDNRNFPSDCNGGSGFDCLSDISNAKNILVVGAVSKVTNYTGPSSVQMSTFSSWGPTDDGRIKPDIVAAGVNLFSTIASPTNNQYGTLSGTSMATPNATGSLALLQELYASLHGGNLMKAATVKALAIHSAKEAGIAPGPDYSFGWGLLDVEAGAKVIINEDKQNTYIEDQVLQQGAPYIVTLSPKATTKITVTLAWNDPAGTPVAPSLDPVNAMLVNDLDLRLVDDANNTVFPWALNPQDPGSPATRSDNHLDNVEKIEFANPEQREYRVVVNHKGVLSGGSQAFSLIVTYSSLNDPRTAYYWIGNGGSWNSASNWSLSSGGAPAGQVPTTGDRIIVDENSFNAENQSINLNVDATVGSVTWLNKSKSGLSLNGHTLTVEGGLSVSSDQFAIENQGTLLFTGQWTGENNLSFSNSNMTLAKLVFDGNGSQWKLNGNARLGAIELKQGSLVASGINLEVGSIISNSGLARSLDIRNSTFSKSANIDYAATNFLLQDVGSVISFSDTEDATISSQGKAITSDLKGGLAPLSIVTQSTFSSLTVKGTLHVEQNSTIQRLTALAGATISIASGKTLELTKDTALDSVAGNKISVIASGASNAALAFDGHFKLCFDNLIIDGVDVEGTAVINAGPGSVVANAQNWLTQTCDDIIFPDFTFDYACMGSLTTFTDLSSGEIDEWAWDFGDIGSASNTSANRNPTHVYEEVGTYTVTLTAAKGGQSRSYEQNITIGANDLPSNTIVVNNSQLFSFRAASSYQWYQDNELIENATARAYEFMGVPGYYYVVTFGASCNLVSAPLLITGTENEIAESTAFKVYPVPATDQLNLELSQEWIPAKVSVITAIGQTLMTEYATSTKLEINVSSVSPGPYVIVIESSNEKMFHKLILIE